jgi:hypothetical protein
MGTCQLRKKIPREEHQSSKIDGGWRKVHKQTHTNDLSRNPKEGQGLHRAEEPMMMIMKVINYENKH